MLLLTRTALRVGPRAGVRMAGGIATGLCIHTTVAVTGLALAFDGHPLLRERLRWIAGGYLLWLAFRIGWAHLRPTTDSSGRVAVRVSYANPFFQGFLCNLLNPKAAIFLAAASAPFLRGDHPVWWPFALWSIVVGQAFVLWSAWALLLQWPPLRSRYERSGKWIDLAFAAALAGLSIRLMWG